MEKPRLAKEKFFLRGTKEWKEVTADDANEELKERECQGFCVNGN